MFFVFAICQSVLSDLIILHSISADKRCKSGGSKKTESFVIQLLSVIFACKRLQSENMPKTAENTGLKFNQQKNYNNLVQQISETYRQRQSRAVTEVNVNMVDTYWQMGQYIVEFEQHGNLKAEYGKALLRNLSNDLSIAHGFSQSNIYLMRLFFVKYPKFQTVSGKLRSLSYIVEFEQGSFSAEAPHQMMWTPNKTIENE